MTWVMLAAILGLVKRPGGVDWRSFFVSPCDWLVGAYLLWIIWTTGDWITTAKALVPFAAFYVVTAAALDTTRRLSIFISCWVIGLATAMVFAISTPLGFEMAPGSADLTESFAERLALNTWIYNNPNSLGHGIVALIPLAYLWLVWKRPAGMRAAGVAVIIGAIYCVIETESKGAYLCGAAAIGAGFLFRKSRIVQIFSVVVMLTVGLGALKMLPRMDTLSNKEAGIAGRLLIWQMAHNAMANTVTGEGWKKFEAWIDTEDYGLIRKATHGSYVNVGADLGYLGLFLFVGIFYASSKTLLLARTEEDDLEAERCQRALLSLTVSFAASAWMIDRAYHTDFFILAGAVTAFHRLMSRQSAGSPQEGDEEDSQTYAVPSFSTFSSPLSLRPQPALAGFAPALSCQQGAERVVSHTWTSGAGVFDQGDASESEDKPFGLQWRRLGTVDVFFMVLCCAAVIQLWQRMMTSFISF